jgi:hypothetical protein
LSERGGSVMPGPSPTFITRVSLKSFRSIAQCDVSLGPLTFLVGATATLRRRTVKLGLIVEGHGETTALLVLLRRLARELVVGGVQLDIPPPLRLTKSKMLVPGELDRAVELMARKTAPDGAILVLLDADDDCAAQLGPKLLQRARAARNDRQVRVVIANREYESWFISGAAGLRGYRGFDGAIAGPPNAELIRNAKGWLDSRLAGGYHETTDQPRLSERFDLADARAS